MKPLVPFVSEVAGAELVRASRNAQLWRAWWSGKRVALRLFRLRPLIAPPAIMERAAEIDAQLELAATAKMIAAGESGDGWYVAEEWIEGSALRTDLRHVAADLLRLHRAGKWHGGVTPSRVVSSRGRGILVARSWATFLSTLPREQLASFAHDRDLAPELCQYGPSAAGPANDVYGFAQVLAARGQEGLLVRRALSIDVGERPTLRELLG